MPKTKNHDPVFKAEVDELVEKLMSTRRPWALRRARRQFERSYTEYMIRRSANDRHKAAERLQIGFSTLKEKIRKTKPKPKK